jgi:hypothetical protein
MYTNHRRNPVLVYILLASAFIFFVFVGSRTYARYQPFSQRAQALRLRTGEKALVLASFKKQDVSWLDGVPTKYAVS